MKKYYLAIDIGASSGRHIVGWREEEQIRTKEVFRFANGAQRKEGHLVWDLEHLFSQVKQGIRIAMEEYGSLESLSVDSWGVDYVLMDGEREILPAYAYRDWRTQEEAAGQPAATEAVHEKMDFEELYRRTGCQFQPFNTIYQLYDDLRRGRLDRADSLLMLPEYLMYRLTGRKAREYTNATTTGLVNAWTGRFDREIIRALELPERFFPDLAKPGTSLGRLLPEVASEVGGDCRVILCATHDTASAVEGIPGGETGAYISSGTWSLLGARTGRPLTDEASRLANFSNEGGVGYNRYQKNIMGLWLVQRLREEMCPELSFDAIVAMAQESGYEEVLDADAPELLAPESMKKAFDSLLSHTPQKKADYFRCAYRSLAESYGRALGQLEHNAGKNYDKLYIVGGGAKNGFLNRLTQEATKKNVEALPIEAAALGNLKIQMEAEQ